MVEALIPYDVSILLPDIVRSTAYHLDCQTVVDLDPKSNTQRDCRRGTRSGGNRTGTHSTDPNPVTRAFGPDECDYPGS
jgi:hypothetical protein